MDEAETQWLEAQIRPVGPVEEVHDRPWSRVATVPTADGRVWFKRCAPVQAQEVPLTVALAQRWPHLVPEVLAYDADRAWLLFADAGVSARSAGNPPQWWLEVLPYYAELQRGETAYAEEHLRGGLPDLRLEVLRERFEGLLGDGVPVTDEERARLAAWAPTFARWCEELASYGVPASVQHDDMHDANLFRGDRLRIIDWGDCLVSHPFASLVVMSFSWMDDEHPTADDNPWFGPLRDAYLEPWGDVTTLRPAFDLAQRVGTVAHAIAWIRQRAALPDDWLPRFDRGYRPTLESIVAYTEDSSS